MNNDLLTEFTNGGTSRRQALKSLGLGAAGLAGLNFLARRTEAAIAPALQATSLSTLDADILQFALNLEYLEGQYYSYAVSGQGLNPAFLTGSGTPGDVMIKPGARVRFTTPAIEDYAREITADERTHVLYLRSVLQFFGVQPVAQPAINLRTSFDAAAQAAGIGSSFDPFASETNFILGAFIFEDVGVTAYKGAAPLIESAAILTGAAGLLGTEAYHASNIRTTIFAALGGSAIATAGKISNLRDSLDGAGDDDQGVVDANGKGNIVPTAANGGVFGRTTRQVLNILYFAPNAHMGGFFPNGLNGSIT